MKKVKIGIVEDEAIIAETIEITLESLGYETIDSCATYTDALEMIKSDQPDLVLVDIRLAGKKTGIDLANEIRNSFHIPFVFLTSNSDPATVELAKGSQPDAFLVKPFSKDDLFTAIEIALSNHAQKLSTTKQDAGFVVNDAIFIKKNDVHLKVPLDSILYLMSDHVYVEFHCEKDDKHVVRGKLTDFLEKLGLGFMQVHRRYVVNLRKIDAVGSQELIINTASIPLSKSHKEPVLLALNRI